MEKKEFIFPMNYKNKEKFLGFIDYKVIITIVIFSFCIFLILKNIEISLLLRVIVFIVLVGFFSIFIIVGINGENMLDFLWFMAKFFLSERIYVYRKVEKERRNKICENLLNHISQ